MFVSTTGEEKAASQQRQHNTQRNDGRNTERKDGVRDTAIWQRLRVDVLVFRRCLDPGRPDGTLLPRNLSPETEASAAIGTAATNVSTCHGRSAQRMSQAHVTGACHRRSAQRQRTNWQQNKGNAQVWNASLGLLFMFRLSCSKRRCASEAGQEWVRTPIPRMNNLSSCVRVKRRLWGGRMALLTW